MTPACLFAAALALAAALASPVASFPDRYKDGSRARSHPAEATVPQDDADRQKRAYSSWTDYEGFTRWKPSPYQLSRPYFIPVYGAAGKVPIYFPPQKLHLNPGTPLDNPLPNRPFRGPGYLPPTTEKAITMTITNRFNDDEDDRPVWGASMDENASTVIPTRFPKVSDTTEFPPLIHDISKGSNALAAESEDVESAPASRITTIAPPRAGPSNCAWAIVSCCSASSTRVPDSCFEQRGCPGPFWGMSPCDSEFAKSAIASALNYYQSR
ncbi:uncharacterized protein LOC108913748 [Anoplophora glabripennis]|uniref:uncharacterized protein LOC108913748 n=1 Tax=Anoplophora glabripennis TaxID=217634 RepID=UPI0008756AA5|nr:uncharacterized protein LOC108913748 [Anoplophora glabripennis]XP_018574879.1 uncharacterized protein LOC108913748 [Anoplophora glabripennis]XP_018574880.1 uncharacterized protein LOC108913748 [Anoplophora glabripennis]